MPEESEMEEAAAQDRWFVRTSKHDEPCKHSVLHQQHPPHGLIVCRSCGITITDEARIKDYNYHYNTCSYCGAAVDARGCPRCRRVEKEYG